MKTGTAKRPHVQVKLDQRLPRSPPSEFRIFPAGEWESSKGTFLFDEQSGALVLDEWRTRGLKLTFDYEHAALEPAGEIAEGAPNAGNFDLELRGGELWAVNIHWTDRAADYLRAGEYLYFSPAFAHDADGRVTRLVNIALTNLPATFGQEPLVAASERTKHMDEAALKKLTDSMTNLSECLTKHGEALQAHAEKMAEFGKPAGDDKGKGGDGGGTAAGDKGDDDGDGDEEKKATKALREKLAALTGKANVSEALGALSAMKEAAAKLSDAQGELAKLKAEKVEAEVVALVDGAIRDGKMTPAQKAQFLEIGKKDLAFLKGYVASAPKITGGTKPVQEPQDGKGGAADPVASLSDVERESARQLGVTAEAFAANKARRLKDGTIPATT